MVSGGDGDGVGDMLLYICTGSVVSRGGGDGVWDMLLYISTGSMVSGGGGDGVGGRVTSGAVASFNAAVHTSCQKVLLHSTKVVL